MEKEYLSKQELEIKLNSTEAKYYKLEKIDNCVLITCSTIALINAIIVGASFMIATHVHMGFLISCLTTFGSVPVLGNYFDNKKKKIYKQKQNIKNQLDDIVSMEFEKKRYALEIKNSNISCNNDLLKSIQEEKALLEKYKQDLNYYGVHRVDKELSNEINNRNYMLQKLNQLK